MTNRYKKILYAVSGFFLLAGVFLGGAYVGYLRAPAIDKINNILNKEPDGVSTSADFDPFWKVWNLLNQKALNNSITDQDKVWGAISGLASSLGDPYTTFFPPQENKVFQDTIAGSFGGIGAEVDIKDKVLTVVAPLKGTPAYDAGLKPGDKIIKIDGTSTADLTVDKAVSLLRGDEGTTVKLTIIHDGDINPVEVNVKREIIPIPTIDTELRPDGIFVISLYSFSENSASLFRDALRKFVESGSNKLILDLRGNPGGYLDAAVDMASWFLPLGDTVVSEDYGGKQDNDVYRSKGYDIFSSNLKFMILVDGGSASASEILSGALQEHGVAKLVGQQTYGKGSVQELINVTPDTSIKITVAKWLTPNGISISEKGLTPDYVVAMDPNNPKADPIMDKAAQLLNQ